MRLAGERARLTDYQALAASCDLENYAECYEAVRATFAPFPGAVVVHGKVPDTLAEVKADKVCYLSLDMNCAGEWYLRQKEALDRFARRGVEVLSLPTGQGLILKP